MIKEELKLRDMIEDKDYSLEELLNEWGQVKLYHYINRGDIFRIRTGIYRKT